MPQYVAHGMAHAAAQTVSSVVIRGTPIDEAIREGVIAGAVDAVAQYGANRISDAYTDTTLNVVTHKLAHGVLGAGIAVAQGRTQTHEIVGAAAGGMLGEIIAESLTDIPAITRSAAEATAHVPAAERSDAIAAHTREQLRPTNVISRMAAVGIAGALGGDPHLAAQTAQNAVENNWVHFVIMGVFAMLEAKHITEVFKKEGLGAAAKETAISVGTAVVGGAALKIGVNAVRGAKGYIMLNRSAKAARTGAAETTAVAEGTATTAGSRATTVSNAGAGGKVAETSTIEALDLAGTSQTSLRSAKINGNSNKYIGDTHVYVIRDAETGVAYKIGESMQGLNKYGLSKRAQTQVSRLERHQGLQTRSQVRRTFSTKAEAREYETQLIQRYRRMFGENTLPGNKGVR